MRRFAFRRFHARTMLLSIPQLRRGVETKLRCIFTDLCAEKTPQTRFTLQFSARPTSCSENHGAALVSGVSAVWSFLSSRYLGLDFFSVAIARFRRTSTFCLFPVCDSARRFRTSHFVQCIETFQTVSVFGGGVGWGRCLFSPEFWM